MPLDPCCSFVNWEITDDTINFPFGYGSTKWIKSTHWLSYRNDEFILIRGGMVSIGNVKYSDSTTTHVYLNTMVPGDCIVRGWLLEDGFMFSPECCPLLAMYPEHPQLPCRCVIGVPVKHVCVCAEGDYFVVYNENTKSSTVYSADMVCIGSFEYGLLPTAITICDDETEATVTFTHEYTGTSMIGQISIPKL